MAGKRFVYLIQSEAGMPYPDLPDPSVDVILLTWKSPSPEPGAIHFPGSSWNEGRNRLLLEARRRSAAAGGDYLYYIFLDDDCEVREDRELAARSGAALAGNPFRTFERFLLEWEPAVGYTRYDWQHCEEGRVVNLGYNFDALFNAYHREAAGFLLPYYTGFDAESWLYSQHIVNHLAALLYNPYRIQCNLVRTANRRRKGYRQRRKYWEIPTTFLRTAIRSSIARGMRVERPNDPEPIGGAPRKKDRSYRLAPAFVEEHFDTAHPLIRNRRASEPDPAPPPPPERPPVAVLMSGRCRGLDRTAANLFECLFSRLGDWDLFVFTPEDAYSHLAERLRPTVLEVAPDPPLDEGRLRNGKNCLLKTGVQAYLQQLYGLRRCDAIRIAHQRRTGARYDWVVRCRPDLLFEAPVPDLHGLDPRYVHVPDFHQFEGVNDRFAVGNPENMTIYMSKFDDFHDYVEKWSSISGAPPVTAEMFTGGQLRQYGVSMRLLPVRFNRVRDGKVKQDTGRR